MRRLVLCQMFKLWWAAFRRAKNDLFRERIEYREKLEAARIRFERYRRVYIDAKKASDSIGNLCNIPGFPANAAHTIVVWASGIIDKKDLESLELKLIGFEGVSKYEADMEFYKANMADLDIFIEELDEKLKSIGR